MAWNDLSGGQKAMALGVSALVLWALFGGQASQPLDATPAEPLAVAQEPACGVRNMSVNIGKHQFVDKCKTRACPVFEGVATVTNGCAEPMGIELKVTAFDSTGAPVRTRNLWPASVKNLPPGDTVVSIDQYVDYDPSIDRVELAVNDVRRWD